MSNLDKYTTKFFLFLLFSPLLSYITLTWFSVTSQYYMGVLFTFLGLTYLVINKSVKIPGYVWLLFLYIIYTLIWSYYTGEFERRGYRVFIKNPQVHVFFTLIVIHNVNLSDNFIRKVIPILKYTIIIAAIGSIVQVLNYSFMNANPAWAKWNAGDLLTDDVYGVRRASFFGFIDPNELGLSYMPLISILIGILLYQRNRFYYIFLILGGISAFLSNTRYVMVAFLIITFQILFFQKNKIRAFFKYGFFILVAGILLIKVIVFLGYDIQQWYSQRLFPEGSITETTRYKAIDNFIQFFPKHVFVGYGGPTEEITAASVAVGSSQIHVGYLAHLVYFGITGSVLLFGFWFLLARKIYKTAKASGYWGSFFAFIVFLWANATLVTFHIFFYGLIYALIFDKYFSDKVLKSKLVRLAPQTQVKLSGNSQITQLNRPI